MQCNRMGLGKYWFLLLLWTWSVLANTDYGLVDKLLTYKSFSAEFEQVIASNKGEILEHREGTLDVARPGKLYWKDSSGQTVVANGSVVYIYFSDLNQVQQHNQTTLLKYSPAGLLLKPAKTLLAEYHISHVEHAGQNIYTLRPRLKDGLVHSMQIGFKKGVLQKFVITDWNYNLISIYLKNLHPKSFNASKFEFIITPNMEVLQQPA